jgi:hypothetical protein
MVRRRRGSSQGRTGKTQVSCQSAVGGSARGEEQPEAEPRLYLAHLRNKSRQREVTIEVERRVGWGGMGEQRGRDN